MQAAHETTRVDMRELQHILTSTSPPVDLETDIEVCAEPSEPAVVARSTRLAHTVRRAESQAEAVAAPGATVEMQAIQIAAAHAAAEPDLAPLVAEPRRRDRTAYYAAAAFVVAAISLVAVVVSM